MNRNVRQLAFQGADAEARTGPGRGLASRRRAIAAVATALAAVALAAGVAGRGCLDGAEDPDGAMRAFLMAARTGDREAVFRMLGPATLARLDQAAARTTELIGSGRAYAAIDLIEVDQPGAGPISFEIFDEEADRAAVELIDQHGDRSALTLVRVGDAWRIELPDREGVP